jgi:hypothetical protein
VDKTRQADLSKVTDVTTKIVTHRYTDLYAA